MILVPVMSGKGGVGKTTVCMGVGLALVKQGIPTAILDLDLENPSLGTACGLTRKDLTFRGEHIIPPTWQGLRIMSLSLMLLPDFIYTPTLVVEERKHELITQLAKEVDWGDSEVILVDMPPGSGEEVRGLLQFPIAGTVLVTAPQSLSEAAVRRLVLMAEEYSLPILGIVENNINRAPGEAGQRISEDYKILYLGKIGWNKEIVESMEAHQPFTHQTFTTIAQAISNKYLKQEEADSSDNSVGFGAEGVVHNGSRDGQQEGTGQGDQREVSGVLPTDSGDGNSPAPTGDRSGCS